MKLKFLRFSCQGALILAQPNPFQVLPQIPARKSPQTPACPWKVRWMTKVSSSVGFTVSFFGQLGHWPSNLQQQQEDFIADDRCQHQVHQVLKIWVEWLHKVQIEIFSGSSVRMAGVQGGWRGFKTWTMKSRQCCWSFQPTPNLRVTFKWLVLLMLNNNLLLLLL